MVCLSWRNLVRKYNHSFVDKVRIHVKGGTGGNGVPSLGGVGGRGGDVYVVASPDPKFLLKEFQKRNPLKKFAADNGQHGSRRALCGLQGASIYIKVPVGVEILDGTTEKKMGEINNAHDKILVSRGGKGGNRLNRFVPAKSKGKNLFLDLKLIADVGFVGFPNAGKSTLLSKLSRASPKIANYPFTTLNPEIGVIKFDDFRKISLADLPGLIEGAHVNMGRGHSFLKHIERTHLLMFVVDVNGFQLSYKSPFRDAFETVQLLTKELELYDKSLIDKPALLVVNKMDTSDSQEKLSELKDKLSNFDDHLNTLPLHYIPKKQLQFQHIVPISANEGSGTEKLKLVVREILDERSFLDNELECLKLNSHDEISKDLLEQEDDVKSYTRKFLI